MKNINTLDPIQRLRKFKHILDNSVATNNTLSQQSHNECFEMIKKLRMLHIHSYEASDIIENLQNLFISKFEYNRPVDWYFKKWSKTSFKSDAFLSMLISLEDDYKLISNESIGYINLY